MPMPAPEQLAQSPLFADLPPETLSRLAALSEEIICRAGEALFREGEEASRLYILLSGKVNVQVQPIALTQPLRIVLLNTPGELVGWSGFMPPSYYTATAICQQDSRLLAFDGAAFNRLLDENPVTGLVIMRRIAAVISQRLRTIQGIVLKNLYHHDEQ
ncbi:MAG: cyclic nucleotide-binding domain-containing protein [Chloroflexi bacterium]|nr:MAG: cyclic nucleotide-binding domain-containing protein [Chloroflexota bacterium]